MSAPLNTLGTEWFQTLWAVSWQASIIIGLVWLLSLLTRRSAPAFRYWLWCIVLLRLCLPFDLKAPLGAGHYFRRAAEAPLTSLLREPATAMEESIRSDDSVDVNTTPIPFGHSATEPSLSGQPVAGPTVRTGLSLSERVALSWLAAIAIFAGLIVLKILWVRRLVKHCPKVTRPELVELLKRLRESLGISQPVDLRKAGASNAARGPVVIGVLRPKILIPAQIANQWAISEIEPLLLHELGHIKRRDLLMNWIQILVQVVYFFHPLVWYANWKIRRERELACDDLAVAYTERGKRDYTQSLLRMLEESKRGFALGLAGLGVSEPRNSITRRIHRIMDRNYQTHRGLGRAGGAVLVLLSLLLFIVSGDRSRAGEGTAPADLEPVPLGGTFVRHAPVEHAGSKYRAAPPSEDPLVYLSFDNGDATDDSDQGHNGLIHGELEFLQGVRGKGVRFDGGDDWIEVPGGDLSGPVITTSVWVFVEKGLGGVVLAKNAWMGTDTMNYGTEFDSRRKHLPTCVSVRTEDADDDNDYWVSYEFPEGPDEWVHIVQVLTDEQNALYVNGHLKSMARTPLEFLPYMGAAPLQIGGDPLCTREGKGRFFNGAVDEVRVYNRALSAEEIRRLFHECRETGE